MKKLWSLFFVILIQNAVFTGTNLRDELIPTVRNTLWRG